jgi:hypothetical protein
MIMAKEKKTTRKKKRPTRKNATVRDSGTIYKNGSKLVSVTISTENIDFLESEKLYSRSYTVNAALNKLRELMEADKTIILK